MIQDIMVFVILISTAIIIAYRTVKNIKEKQNSACGGCNGCDLKKGCSLQNNLK